MRIWRFGRRLTSHSTATWWRYDLEYEGDQYSLVLQAKSWKHGRSQAMTLEHVWLSEDDIYDTGRAEAMARKVGELSNEDLAILIVEGKLRRIR